MTLFEKLKDIVPMGYRVWFSTSCNQLRIEVLKGTEIRMHQESWLPMSDHFYESKLVDCIDYMVNEIRQIENNKNDVKKVD